MSFSDSIHDYNFELPAELIAQKPASKRDEARLLVVRRNPTAGLPRFEDLLVSDLPQLVAQTPSLKDAIWVRNRSRVLPARFYVRRPTGGRHEVVLLEEIPSDGGLVSGVWKALIRGQADFKYPQALTADTDSAWKNFAIVSPEPGLIDLRALGSQQKEFLESVGEMPLPPYIKNRNQARDRERYQSVWADESKTKSAAAPTASLHFTPELVSKLEAAGVRFADLYLHVGLGTFAPVRVELLSQHTMHSEALEVSETTRALVSQAATPSCVAIGTTALRAVESLPRGDAPTPTSTNLFVKPGFEFRYTRHLWTNFHLPESTLLVMIATFAGSLELALEAYQHAVDRKYRFFSYGDASIWI